MRLRSYAAVMSRTVGIFLIIIAISTVLFTTFAGPTSTEERVPTENKKLLDSVPVSSAASGTEANTPRTIPPDVIIGTPREIPYASAFPLLDGLFQDVSAIQLAQLSLNANQGNASNIDAVIQQFQGALQYSQTLGIQNATAAQQSAAVSANNMLQTQLLNQASQLIGLQLAAQQQVGQAQTIASALPANATEDQKAAAQQAVQIATDNLNAVTAQITNVKTLLSTTAPSVGSFSAPAPSPVGFPTPPVAITIPSAGGNPPFTPSFPASKQMENQVNLLWERLAHLVNTLAQSENPNGISLVRFHTGIVSGKKENRKRKLLSTQYALRCTTPGTAAPRVLDLFPRNAAVNISNMKYRDSRFTLAGLLSLFSVGANAAYNREHLQITQALGQSAYITGFGIETDSFGWVFSPSLGEEIVAPGDRTTFALVSAPSNCGTVEVDLLQATWDKAPVALQDEKQAIKTVHSWIAEPTATELCNGCVQRLAYAPIEFDPANPGVGAVTVNLRLNVDLDREQTVTVNGIVVKRARDTYGRATANGGSGGLLQANSLDAGTWIPISSKELVLNLNPTLFTRRFPAIILSSPRGSIDINKQLGEAGEIEVAGVTYKCPNDSKSACGSVIPPIGRPKAVSKNFAVARWVTNNKFIITVQQPTAATAASSASSAIPAVQVITGAINQSWSGVAKVVALQDGEQSYVPLRCAPLGERLLCDRGQLDIEKKIDFEIYDTDYVTGPIKGSGVAASCSGDGCADPLIWEMDAPRWRPQNSAWMFRLSLINVERGQIVELNRDFSGAVQCANDSRPCAVTIELPITKFSLIRDLMRLQVYRPAIPQPIRVGSPSTIGNLRIQVSPILSNIVEDQTRFSGQNLVFNQIRVGSRDLPIQCAETRDCFVPSPGFKPGDEGYLYFLTGGEPFPFMLITDKGLQVVAPHKPKPAPAGQATASPTPPAQPTQTQIIQLQINPSTRLNSVKEQ